MFENFLANASSAQLLLCLAGPLVGAIIFAGVLFLTFASRNGKKDKMKLGPQSPQAALSQRPVFMADRLTPPMPLLEPLAEQDTSILLNQELASPQTPGHSATPGAEIDLNLSVLSHLAESGSNRKVETEDLTMGLSRQPHEDRTGLAARINSRPSAMTETANPTASQPASYPPPSGPGHQPASQPQTSSKSAKPVELLRLLRDPQSGQLIVEIAGRRYTKLADIADKQIGAYILKLAAHFLAFTNGMIATEAGIKSLPAPKVGETPLPPVTPKPVSQLPDPLTGLPSTPPLSPEPAPVPPPSPEATAALLASLTQVKPLTPEPKRRGLFGRAKPAAQEEPILPALNLAEQINTIAQAHLLMSPLAVTTKLEITSDPGGGIRINVNGRFYSSPNDIPDPQVKALIKDSIRQWEKS